MKFFLILSILFSGLVTARAGEVGAVSTCLNVGGKYSVIDSSSGKEWIFELTQDACDALTVKWGDVAGNYINTKTYTRRKLTTKSSAIGANSYSLLGALFLKNKIVLTELGFYNGSPSDQMLFVLRKDKKNNVIRDYSVISANAETGYQGKDKLRRIR